jgi:hypothetical protein
LIAVKLAPGAKQTNPNTNEGEAPLETLTANNHPIDMANFHHMISKLRWIGQDDEAESLLRARSRQDNSSLIWPVEIQTD